jgi:AcrR family transcriptional regulator
MMPKIVDKESKKNEIMQAAMKVFARKGVVKTKMIDIAEEAAIGKGTIYEYYRSKDDIFADVFHFFFLNMEKSMQEGILKISDPIEKLKYIIDFSIRNLIQSDQKFMRIMMDFWAEGIRNKDEKILQIMDLNEIYLSYRSLFSDILQDGINKGIFKKTDTHSLASILIGALDGIMLQWIMDPDIFDLNQISNIFLDCFLSGIKK